MPPQLQILYDWLMKGDGYIGGGNEEYSTISKRLADDVQEIVLKLGKSANVYKRKTWYIVGVSKTTYHVVKNVTSESYTGNVWCLEVPNHTLYVRRNGKACFCGNSAGAQAVSNLDTLLAPYIKKDRLRYEEVKQHFQAWLYHMNAKTRVGGQTPFTNVTLDLDIPKFMEDEYAVIGGKLTDLRLGDCRDEVDLFNKAFLDVMIEGDKIGRILSFPIPTYNITKEFNWNYEPLFRLTAKYGVPYFANFINSDLKPEDTRSLCCRLRLDTRELKKRGGGLFGANPKTGSVGVVTINMPRLGYFSKEEDDFFGGLDNLMDLAMRSLELKRAALEDFMEKGLYPYSEYNLRGIKERFGSYWKNHFSTIGLVGMNECCLNFLSVGIETDDGLKFSEKVLRHMRERLMDYQGETNNIYNLEATPAEGTSYSLARMDKTKWPDIRVANEEYLKQGAEPFYTNSTQLPVNLDWTPGRAIHHQEVLQPLYTGGTVFHYYSGEAYPSWEGVSKLIERILSKTRLPYLTFTPTTSVCPTHGYLSGTFYTCPKCGTECEVYSRIVGYFRPLSQWHVGKQSEFAIRKTFSLLRSQQELE